MFRREEREVFGWVGGCYRGFLTGNTRWANARLRGGILDSETSGVILDCSEGYRQESAG